MIKNSQDFVLFEGEFRVVENLDFRAFRWFYPVGDTKPAFAPISCPSTIFQYAGNNTKKKLIIIFEKKMWEKIFIQKISFKFLSGKKISIF